MSASDGRRPATLREAMLRLLDAQSRPDGTFAPAPIVQAGHPALRTVATPFDAQLDAAELAAFCELLWQTMLDAPGVGLAAPQVGISIAVAVMGDPGTSDPEVAAVRERVPVARRVLVNPSYLPAGEQKVAFYEGCLSVNGYQAVVPRPRAIRLQGWDETGAAINDELHGWPARIAQHETDHLGGMLYLDRAELRSLATSTGPGARWALEPAPESAARVLGF